MKTRDQNSLVTATLQELASSLFRDLQAHHPLQVKDLTLDAKTLFERVKAEGVGFLTCALPKLGKAIYAGLECGRFACPSGFARRKGTAIPRFLGGLLTQVFELDGSVRRHHDSSSLADAIQVCFMFYKLDLPYTPAKEQKVIDAFVQTEADLEKVDMDEVDCELLDDAARIIGQIFRRFDPMDIRPAHGPGAVATGEKITEKWTFKRKYAGIHRVYPYYEYFVPSRMSLLRKLRSYRGLENRESGVAKVRLVPKDSRGPRLISMEPLEYQFIQQGLSRALVKWVERRSPITSGFVNFTDQGINRSLALNNSVSRRYSTLDLKEASDRVSLKLVEKLFSRTEKLLTCLKATRTSSTELPDGRILPLRKFAPMGSALCFPVEALVFFSLSEALRRRERIGGRVYVYGDDLVVPRELVPHLFEHFPSLGLLFNQDKCFTNGYFRESCGLDAYSSSIVTPTRIRRCLPKSRKDVSALVSAVELSNHLWLRGYWRCSTYVTDVVQRLMHIPVVSSPKENFGGLSWQSFTSKGVITDRAKVRWNAGLQHHQVFCPVSVVPSKRTSLAPEERLFSRLLEQPVETVTVPHAVAIKMRWSYLY